MYTFKSHPDMSYPNVIALRVSKTSFIFRLEEKRPRGPFRESFNFASTFNFSFAKLYAKPSCLSSGIIYLLHRSVEARSLGYGAFDANCTLPTDRLHSPNAKSSPADGKHPPASVCIFQTGYLHLTSVKLAA